MSLVNKVTVVSFLSYLFLPLSTLAAFNFVVNQGMWLTPGEWFAGNKVKVYTVVINNNFEKLSGDLEFRANGKSIGVVVVQNIPYEGAKQIGLEYTLPSGEILFEAKLKNVVVEGKDGKVTPLSEDQVFGLEVSKKITIDIDTDNDKMGDTEDLDDDNDGLLDTDEKKLGTDPLAGDTDKDSLNDKIEIENGTDPLKSDTDGEGLSDSEEKKLGTNPKNVDTDADGVSDKKEVTLAMNPLNKDSDMDGLSDGEELKIGTNPLKGDTDGDGIKDGDEVARGFNPLFADTDKDGVKDGADAFPLDPKESTDINKNGRGDNAEEVDRENIVLNLEASNAVTSSDMAVPVQNTDSALSVPATNTALSGKVEENSLETTAEHSETPYKWWLIGGGSLSFVGFLTFSALYATKKRESEEW